MFTPLKILITEKPILSMCFFILLGVFFSFVTLQIKDRIVTPPEFQSKEIRSGGFDFINPLLECDALPSDGFSETKPIEKNVRSVIEKYKAKGTIQDIAVYFRDLNNGPWFGINEKELFSPASLYKVPLAVAVLKQAESQPNLLRQELVYQEALLGQEVSPNFVPSTLVTLGSTYTIEELLERMIIYSDNEAMALLMGSIDEEKLSKVEKDLGVTLSSDESGEKSISVRSYAGIFRILYNASYLSPEMSDKLLRMLARSEFKAGLPAGLPSDILVAHKFGERGLQNLLGTTTLQLHDCGIIYKKNSPYLLCVMTRGTDFTTETALIKEISSTIYTDVLK